MRHAPSADRDRDPPPPPPDPPTQPPTTSPPADNNRMQEGRMSCLQQPAPPPSDAAKMSPRISTSPEPVLAAHAPSPPATGSHCPARDSSAPHLGTEFFCNRPYRAKEAALSGRPRFFTRKHGAPSQRAASAHDSRRDSTAFSRTSAAHNASPCRLKLATRVRFLWTLECVLRGNVGIHRAPKAIQVDGSRPRRVSLPGFPRSALPYQEPLRVTGPLPSLVLRAEDMWRKHKQCHRSWQGSQSGFPLLTLRCPLSCSAPNTKVLNTVHSWWK